MDVGGSAWTTNGFRRRTTDLSSPRRRNINYGYPGRQSLQQQYGYSMPEKTGYGYSGQGPQRNSYAKLAMAGVAGAALGAGGYYLYYQMKNSNWPSDVTYQDKSWCEVPSGAYVGRLIQCGDCAQKFGLSQCRSKNDCYDSGGCQYQLPKSTRRDDLMSTGFIPAHYTAPLTVTITGIIGNDYLEANICPSTQPDSSTFDNTWLGKSSLEVKMYATLTQMEDFTPPAQNLNPGVSNMSTGVATPFWGLVLALVMVAFRSVLPTPRSHRRA